MKKRMNKKGQFYIIAAVLIVLVIFGLTTVSTYAIVKPEPRTIFDLGSDLNRESYKVIEYGIYNNEDLGLLADNFVGDDIAKYFLKKTDNANIIYVYGTKDNLQSLGYRTEKTGSVTIGGTVLNTFNDYSVKYTPSIIDSDGDLIDDSVEVIIADNPYYFDLKDNEMFYFVIVKERGEETFVKRN